MLVACLFVVNNLYSQLPEKGDYKTRVGIKAPAKVQDWMPVVFNRPPYTDPHAEVDSLSYVEFYRAFKSLADNAPYVDYTFYSGAFSEPQFDRNTKKTLETSIYDKLLLNFQDPAIRLLIIEDILSLGRNFIDNLDSVNVVRNNRDTLERAASDTLSLPVAMTKYAHLYYKYAGNPAYYPTHFYNLEQARENFRSAFKMLRDRNVDPGQELEGTYVNEYYKTCEALFKSNEQKYYAQLLEDYLEIVESCDNLLLPYYDIPDSIKNNESDDNYRNYQDYNYWTNDTTNGIKALFRKSGAYSVDRISDYYLSKLSEYSTDYDFMEKALYVMSELGADRTKAFYEYSVSSYALRPSYLNCLGYAYKMWDEGKLPEMDEYCNQAVLLAPDSISMGKVYFNTALKIKPRIFSMTKRNGKIEPKDDPEGYSIWDYEMTLAADYLDKMMKLSPAFVNSKKIDERDYPRRAAFHYYDIMRFTGRTKRESQFIADNRRFIKDFLSNEELLAYNSVAETDMRWIRSQIVIGILPPLPAEHHRFLKESYAQVVKIFKEIDFDGGYDSYQVKALDNYAKHYKLYEKTYSGLTPTEKANYSDYFTKRKRYIK